MNKNKRKILLFLDNCTAPNKTLHLLNVGVECLLVNTTAKLQRMDQGIIRNFKFHYRKEVIDYILTNIEQVEGSVGSVSYSNSRLANSKHSVEFCQCCHHSKLLSKMWFL